MTLLVEHPARPARPQARTPAIRTWDLNKLRIFYPPDKAAKSYRFRARLSSNRSSTFWLTEVAKSTHPENGLIPRCANLPFFPFGSFKG